MSEFKIVRSKALDHEIGLRWKSQTRRKQIQDMAIVAPYAFNANVCPDIGGSLHALEALVGAGVASLQHDVTYSEERGLAFVGSETEVLDRIRAVPLAKDGARARRVLVRMILLRLKKISDRHASESSRKVEEAASAKLLRQKIGLPGQAWATPKAFDIEWDAFLAFTRKVADADTPPYGYGSVQDMLRCMTGMDFGSFDSVLSPDNLKEFFSSEDVTEDVLREGYDLWVAKSVTEE